MSADYGNGQHPPGDSHRPDGHWQGREDDGHGLPPRDRWQPLRAGLVDLFLYDDEEFRFRDGHLLLRGNNGTGKSKVLALTLPFLFDGELAPHRVEPDADPAKRMEWNLLLGGRYQERLGYTWLEFGRLTEEGTPAYLTLGCGLKAAAGRGIAARWFFVTSQRVGADLHLVSTAGTALVRERLIEALAERGRVYDSAEAYRRAVDEALFHLGPDRYDALVNLLVQLRQPQLSKRPDAPKLSRALSQALAPVDQAVLADVAESFHDLEQQRDELRGLTDTRTHVERFLDRYRHYARIASRRQAAELRSAQASYEATNRQLATVREEVAEASAAMRTTEEELRGTERDLAAARASAQELASRSEIKDLSRAEELAKLARGTADRARRDAGDAERVRERRQEARTRAAEAAGASRQAVLTAAEEAAAAAVAAGTARDHELLVAPLSLPDGPGDPSGGVDEPALGRAGGAAAALARRREQAVGHVRSLVERAARLASRLAGERHRLDELTGQRDAAAEARRAAEQALAAAGRGLVEEWRAYTDGLAEVRLADQDGVLAALAEWTDTLAGANPARAAITAAGADARNRLAESRAEALAQLHAAKEALAELVRQRDRLERGEHEQPPPPYTRAAGVRDGRAGAPLWQVVDFREGVGEAERAGLEAALEAAGLLDAWVAPDGRLLDPSTHDVVVTAGVAVTPNLGAVLRPAVDRDDPPAAALSDATVAAVLTGIGLGPGGAGAWVDPVGGWRLGVAQGAWAKPAARFIGRGAREAARRRRLAELAQEIAEAKSAVGAADRYREAAEARQRALEAELAGTPDDQPLRDAHTAASRATTDLQRCQKWADAQEAAVAEAATAAAGAEEDRDQAAADLALPTEPEALQAVRDAVGAYRTAVARLWPEVRGHTDRLGARRAAEAELREAEEAAQRRAEEAHATDTEAHAAERRRDEVRAQLGATVAEIGARLEAAKAEVGRLEGEAKRLGDACLNLTGRLGNAAGREQELVANLERDTERRSRATTAFQRFAATGLLATAQPELDLPDPSVAWAPDPAVRVARRVEQALAEVESDDPAWDRVQRELTHGFKELADALSRYGHEATADLAEDRYVVAVAFQGQRRTPDELSGLLGEEIDHRERVLSAKERELLEEHLVNEVASHLQELIADAEDQVGQMNAELEERPTSTGMRLRFRWEPLPDGPPGLAEARRRLLRQASEAWSVEDRAAVSAFLQEQIAAERARDDSGTWLEHLTAALDYRAWHRFTIERWQDGRWRSAAGPASSGERVLTVTLPLFAAASAHYRSAQPAAPRLVLLDEAFAGVDDDARAKCMGLLATFDLDFVMTSEREWGCYPTVPGLAIHQLSRREGIDAVHVTRWEWDGRARTRVEPPARRVTVPPDDGGGERRPQALW
ncbi:MAG TPA: TIGR02680 family protein [Actinomycetes bacterium]